MKQMREPKEYGGERSHYREWRETLHSYMTAHDPLYVELMHWIEDLGRQTFRPEHLVELAGDLDLDAQDLIEAKHVLYTVFTTYTAGTVKASIRRGKAERHIRSIPQGTL